jgi:hypothetical protein
MSNAMNQGMLTLIGAGELMPASSKLHRDVLATLKAEPRAVFLDTTAGFESNAGAITAKAVEYYKRRLQTDLIVASFGHAVRATATDIAGAIANIRVANLIFAGPGSPTYALDQWRNSAIWKAVVEQFHNGAHLLFASAASITLGRFALPVYEIFKAGQDPYWEAGLDLLADIGLDAAVIPHFNDNSGGENYDSRFCYMGAARFDILQTLLPPEVTILGIDEYTAVRFEPAQGEAFVQGQGGLTVLADGMRKVYPAGTSVPFRDLHSSRREVIPMSGQGPLKLGYAYADLGTNPESADENLNALLEYVAHIPSLDSSERIELFAQIEVARKKSAAVRPNIDAALIDLLIEMRTGCRSASMWELADQIRDALIGHGYEIQDTPEGTIWRRV